VTAPLLSLEELTGLSVQGYGPLVPRFRASHCRNATHFSVLQIVKYPTGLRRNGTS
jgi:hypothetical protein